MMNFYLRFVLGDNSWYREEALGESYDGHP